MSEDNKTYWDEIEEKLKRIELERQREKEAFAVERDRRKSRRKGRSSHTRHSEADSELLKQYEEVQKNTGSRDFLKGLEKDMKQEERPPAPKPKKEPIKFERASLEDKEVEETLSKLWDDTFTQMEENAKKEQKDKKLSKLFSKFKKEEKPQATGYQTAVPLAFDNEDEEEELSAHRREPEYIEKPRQRKAEPEPKKPEPFVPKSQNQEELSADERLKRAEEIEKRWTQKLNLKDLEEAQQKIDDDLELARYQLSVKPTFKPQTKPAEPLREPAAGPAMRSPANRDEKKEEPWPIPAPGAIPPESEAPPGSVYETSASEAAGNEGDSREGSRSEEPEQRLKRAEEIEKRWTQRLTLEDIQEADAQRKRAGRNDKKPLTEPYIRPKIKKEPVIPMSLPEKPKPVEEPVKTPEEDDVWMFKTPPEIKKETLIEKGEEVEQLEMFWNVETPKKTEESAAEPVEFRWTTEPEPTKEPEKIEEPEPARELERVEGPESLEKTRSAKELDQVDIPETVEQSQTVERPETSAAPAAAKEPEVVQDTESRLKQAEEIEKRWTQKLTLEDIQREQQRLDRQLESEAKQPTRTEFPKPRPTGKPAGIQQNAILGRQGEPAESSEETEQHDMPEERRVIPDRSEIAARRKAVEAQEALRKRAMDKAPEKTPADQELENKAPEKTPAGRKRSAAKEPEKTTELQTDAAKTKRKTARTLARVKLGKIDRRLPFEKQWEQRKEQYAVKKEYWGQQWARRLSFLGRWEKRLSNRTAIAVQKLDIRIEKFLFFMDVVEDRIENRFWDFLDYAENHKMRLLAAFAAMLVLLIGVTVFIGSITAYEYIYNGRVLGVVKDQDYVYTTIDVIGTKLGDAYETSIEIDKERDITFNTVRGLDLELDNQEEILNKLTYMKDIKAKGYAIFVDGEQIAILQNHDVAEHVLDTITSRYTEVRSNAQYTQKADFAENVEIREMDILLGEIEREDEVLEYMLTGSVAKEIHPVAKGQTFSEIATIYGLSQEELLAMNPGVQPEKLQIGQEIILTKDSPIVTVETVEVATYDMPIAFETVYQDDASMYKDETRTITAGVSGVEEVVAEIVRHNGNVVERNIISKVTLSEPSNAVVAVGTKERPALVGTGSFSYPIRNYRISSHYGSRWGRMHKGTDFAATTGTPIYAADGGTVTFAGYKGSFGYLVIINHGGGKETYYAHCSKLHVSTGQKVYKGQHIANVGNTGNSTGPHLHFEVHINGSAKNPMNYL